MSYLMSFTLVLIIEIIVAAREEDVRISENLLPKHAFFFPRRRIGIAGVEKIAVDILVPRAAPCYWVSCVELCRG